MTATTMLAAEVGGGETGLAALAIADELTGRDFEVLTPGWDGSHLLKVIARGLLCEVLVSADGSVAWECRPCGSGLVDPARAAEMVRRVLGGGPAGESPGALPGELGFTSIAGRMLADGGLAVSVKAYVSKHFGAYCEIVVTNPARPGRGRARVNNDGLVIWHCRIRTQPGDDQALDPGEIAGIITQALTGTDHA